MKSLSTSEYFGERSTQAALHRPSENTDRPTRNATFDETPNMSAPRLTHSRIPKNTRSGLSQPVAAAAGGGVIRLYATLQKQESL